MVSVHLLDIKTLCAKNALTKIGKRDFCNCHFPLSAIRYAFAAQSLRDNLMTEAYSNYFDKWPLCDESGYPRYELVDPFNVFIC